MIADGNHARADAYVSLAVIASAAVVAIGLPVADPLIGLAITLVILRITWASWHTVRDFLTPNDYWHPKSLQRLRKPNPAPDKMASSQRV